MSRRKCTLHLKTDFLENLGAISPSFVSLNLSVRENRARLSCFRIGGHAERGSNVGHVIYLSAFSEQVVVNAQLLCDWALFLGGV